MFKVINGNGQQAESGSKCVIIDEGNTKYISRNFIAVMFDDIEEPNGCTLYDYTGILSLAVALEFIKREFQNRFIKLTPAQQALLEERLEMMKYE